MTPVRILLPRALGVAAALLVAGCAGGPAADPVATTTSPTTTSASTTTDPSAAAAQYASPTPPASAQMICSDEIRRQVQGALGLAGTPAPQSTWADHVYTCTYAAPVGTLALAVTVAPSDDA